MRHAFAAALLPLLLAFAPTTAGADGQPGSFEIWGFQSLATQSLGDWNARHDRIATLLEFIEQDWHRFGVAIPWGGEIGYRLTRRVTLGVAASQQVAVTQNDVDAPEVVVHERVTVKLRKVVGVVAIEVPGAQGFFVWSDVGWGFGDVEETSSQRIPGDPTQDVDLKGEYDGSGLVYGLAMGMRRDLGGRAMVRLSVGYQFANLGELSGPRTITTPSGVFVDTGPPRDPFTGNPISTDFGGFHFTAGVGFVLNRVR